MINFLEKTNRENDINISFMLQKFINNAQILQNGQNNLRNVSNNDKAENNVRILIFLKIKINYKRIKHFDVLFFFKIFKFNIFRPLIQR